MAANSIDHTDGAEPSLLTITEAARLLRLAPPTLYERVREDPQRFGRVPLGGREVRLRASAIRKLIEGTCTP